MRKLAIGSLGLITSTTTAADASFNDDTAHADQVTVLGFQWISGTVTIGDSTVTTLAGFCILDTISRVKEFRCPPGAPASLPIKDFWCVGSGTFICYYQCH